MSAGHYVATQPIRSAAKGREPEVLDALGIDWQRGRPHVSCPYPGHADENPSWRWDERRARAHCSCIERSHSTYRRKPRDPLHRSERCLVWELQDGR